MTSTARDVRFAFRLLARDPVFTWAAVVTLACGIGINSAVFSLVNGVLLRPLPVRAPQELVRVYSSSPNDVMDLSPMAHADYEDLQVAGQSFEGLFAYFYTPVAVEHDGESRLAMAELVTGRYFSTLGVGMLLGRALTSEDDQSGHPVAVLSHSAWKRLFGSVPDIVGKVLRVNGLSLTVVGVAPDEFIGLTQGVSPALWVPLGTRRSFDSDEAGSRERPRSDLGNDRLGRWLWVVGRRAPGVTFEHAEAEIRTLASRLRQEYPETNSNRAFVAVPAGKVRILPGVDGVLYASSVILMALVGMVLVVSSTNVAIMLLARSVSRRGEIATRLSLGASPRTIARQLLTESLLLSLAGGTLGLLVTVVSNRTLNALRLPIPVDVALNLSVDYRVFGFTFAVAALTTLTFGLAPALEAARLDLVTVLRERGGSGSPRRRWWSRGLVVTQVAGSFLLLVCSGLTLRSMASAHRIDPGFDRSGVVVATFAPHLQGYTRDRAEDFYDNLLRRVCDLNSVTSAAFTSHLPLTIEMHVEGIAADERLNEASEDEWEVDAARVGPGYFETMGIPLLQGRDFTVEDNERSACVAVVNGALAERLSSSGEAIGRRLRVLRTGHPCAVVGIVETGKYRTLGEPQRPFLYRALAQDREAPIGKAVTIQTGTRTLVVRTKGDPAGAMTSIRTMARELDERIAISRLTTLEEATSTTLVLPRIAAMAFGLFGVLGLVLAAIGVYGVMAHTVSHRKREMGIRIAMGARESEILRMILLDGFRLSVTGLIVGWIVTVAITPLLGFMLYGVDANDVASYASVTIFLAFVAGVAAYVPARRASVAEPSEVLRYE